MVKKTLIEKMLFVLACVGSICFVLSIKIRLHAAALIWFEHMYVFDAYFSFLALILLMLNCFLYGYYRGIMEKKVVID